MCPVLRHGVRGIRPSLFEIHSADVWQVIAHNGYADKITVITGMSDNISVGEGSAMPVKADVVVTETMGADLLSELMYNILDDARRRLAKPGAVLIPWAGRVIGQLVQVGAEAVRGRTTSGVLARSCRPSRSFRVRVDGYHTVQDFRRQRCRR